MSTHLEHQVQLLGDAIHASSRFMLRDFNEVIQLQNSTKGVDDFANKCHMRIKARLIEFLNEKRPKYAVITANDPFPENIDYFFVIEPIDGIENFKHGIPFCCSSIALFQKNIEKAIAIVIHNPILRETFYAAEGLGAWLESYAETTAPKSRMRISTQKKLDNAFKRDLGCPLLEIAYFAAGRIDITSGSTENSITKAAFTMVREAGGVVKFKNTAFTASNMELIKQVT